MSVLYLMICTLWGEGEADQSFYNGFYGISVTKAEIGNEETFVAFGSTLLGWDTPTSW